MRHLILIKLKMTAVTQLVWQPNISGAFPIDGDCSRFLLCRQGRQGRQMRQGRLFGKRPPIRGKVYKCPEGPQHLAQHGFLEVIISADHLPPPLVALLLYLVLVLIGVTRAPLHQHVSSLRLSLHHNIIGTMRTTTADTMSTTSINIISILTIGVKEKSTPSD